MSVGAAAAECLGAFGAEAPGRPSIAEAALSVSALERPGLVYSKYVRHLEKLALEAAAYARADAGPAPVELCAETLTQVLARRYGYGGGDGIDGDADSFDIGYVVDGRSGASEAVTILYADVARRIGWQADILGLPGRAVLRLESFGERTIIDPAGGGRELSTPDLRAIAKAFGGIETELAPGSLAPLSDKAAVLRLLAGRKSMLLRSKRLEDAGRVIDCALLIDPAEPALWRECGLLNARLDRIHDAILALEEYLRLGEDDGTRYNTTILLQELRGRLG